MSSKDLKNNVNVVPSINAFLAGVTTVNGTGVDCQGYESVTVSLTSGLLSVGTFKIQESDASGSGFADAAAGDVIGTQGVAVLIDGIKTLGYIGAKRYVRAVTVLSTGGIVAGNVVLSHPHIAPTGAN